MSTHDFPKRLPEKLKLIRERTRLSPDDFASHVQTKDGLTVMGYESGEDFPVSVLLAYAKLAGVPVDNLIDDERNLWFGNRKA